jgi:poly-gamma-glutamate synthesis protein (capsule biosynthesis protein)
LIGVEQVVLRLVFVGDVALGNHPKTPGFGLYSRYGKAIPDKLARNLLPPGICSDLFFGNLEFSLAADRYHPGTLACCLGSLSYLPFLQDAGFTVLNVANNHSWEYGAGNFGQTASELRNAGIKVVGIAEDFDPACYLHLKGKRVAFLGCCARPRQGFHMPPGYNEFEKERFLEQISIARKMADLVCVSIHWGDEFVCIPSPWERETARAMIDAGAAVVVGHHPHVLREIETYRNGIIAYSLGNFICDMTWNPLTRESGCLVLEVEGSLIRSSSFFPAMIAGDCFPRYLPESESPGFLAVQKKRHARIAAELETFGYEFLARKALKKHQWLTLGFFLKNLHRYRFTTLARILSHAARARLPRTGR